VRFLLQPTDVGDSDGLLESGRAALDAGFDGLLLTATPQLPSPLVAGATVGGALPDLLIAVEVVVGDRHPVEVAEEAAVVDQGLAGRLVLVLRPADRTEAEFPEALDLIRTACAARPFRWPGPRWPTPANLPENIHNIERRFRMTPPPFQPRLEVWCAGPTELVAHDRGLGYLADLGSDITAPGSGPAAIGTPRARRITPAPWPQMVDELKRGRDVIDQDWAVIVGVASDVKKIGRQVRPRVQLERLPLGLEDLWAGESTE
jgi:hypothetical protein